MKLLATIACLLIAVKSGGIIDESDALSSSVGQNCDPTLSIYTVNSFVVTPWPPSKNVNLSMQMIGLITQPTTLKSMEIFVFYKGTNFYDESIPETGTYTAGSTATINFKVFLPSIAPSGSYSVQVKLTNTSGAYLNCWTVPFTL